MIWPGDRPRTRYCGLEEVIRERTTLHQTCLSFFCSVRWYLSQVMAGGFELNNYGTCRSWSFQSWVDKNCLTYCCNSCNMTSVDSCCNLLPSELSCDVGLEEVRIEHQIWRCWTWIHEATSQTACFVTLSKQVPSPRVLQRAMSVHATCHVTCFRPQVLFTYKLQFVGHMVSFDKSFTIIPESQVSCWKIWQLTSVLRFKFQKCGWDTDSADLDHQVHPLHLFNIS